MDKFAIITFKSNWYEFTKDHFSILISNQFANKQNMNKTMDCIQEILKISQEKGAENIAINLDYDNIRHYIFFKNTFTEIFKDKPISTVFFLSKVIEITEREDMEKVMDLYHKSWLGGHFGVEKTYKTIAKFFKWENMLQMIKEYIKKCSICEKTKTVTNTKVPMQISSLGEVLFDHVFIDYVGPIPQSSGGHKYIFTGICDLTKYLIAVPVMDCTALTAAQCILEHIICRYNFPSRIISDNATSFLSQIIKELTNLFNIKKVFTTAYHPQANLVERDHRTLNAYLRAFTTKNRDDWHELLK